MSSQPKILSFESLRGLILNVADLKLEDWPIPRGEWGVTVEGNPLYQGQLLYLSPDKKTAVGIERLGPSILRGTHIGETLYFLEGRITARPPGRQPYEIKAGDICHFPEGIDDVWEIHETYTKIFHLHYEPGLPF
jgi:uncharacterized cupin superfamily protein